jgi:glycosyltransferase involved in cell wall biosynthesis
MDRPSVSVLIPTFNEEHHLRPTLEAVCGQTYECIVEVIVADGRSTDRTREVALEFDTVRVVDNPARAQSAGLNRALEVARGEIIVRVDGHCVIDHDYVERCVDALEQSGAAMVGGGMTPRVDDEGGKALQRGIAAAMASRLGAGPARFHVGGRAGWVDTVYLGAFRAADARAVGGYAEDVGVNEDAEFAIRMGARGGVWFDPSIRSSYVPRSSVGALARQFYRYGRSRALTSRRHPGAVRLRQLAAPALVLGLLGPRRRQVAAVYVAAVLTRAAMQFGADRRTAAGFAAALPVMHLCWGVGFLDGVLVPRQVRPSEAEVGLNRAAEIADGPGTRPQ